MILSADLLPQQSFLERFTISVSEIPPVKPQTDHQLAMIVISSLNRQNYVNAIDFESFKESEGIEYTADVLWGLQLQCRHESILSQANKINQSGKAWGMLEKMRFRPCFPIFVVKM